MALQTSASGASIDLSRLAYNTSEYQDEIDMLQHQVKLINVGIYKCVCVCVCIYRKILENMHV